MTGPDTGYSSRRVSVTAAVVVISASAGWAWATRSWAAASSLTGAGAVAIVNLHWLAEVVERVVQAGGPRLDRGSVVRYLLRILLLAGLLAAVLLVPEVDPVAVAVGLTIPLIAAVVEGLRAGHSRG